jgi:hypothetical protein
MKTKKRARTAARARAAEPLDQVDELDQDETPAPPPRTVAEFDAHVRASHAAAGLAPEDAAAAPEDVPDHTSVCGGCGASSTTGHPPCVASGRHLLEPLPGYPLPEWLRWNVSDQRYRDWNVRRREHTARIEAAAAAGAQREAEAKHEAAAAADRQRLDAIAVSRQKEVEQRAKAEQDRIARDQRDELERR